MKRIRINKDSALTFLLSFGMNLAVFLFIILVIRPTFESNDDVTMAMLAENAEGKTNGLLLFSNILYTRFLQTLYSVTRAVKWYVWVQMAGIFVSLTSITYMIYKKANKFYGSIINVLLLSFLSYNTYYKFQFTRTAGICAAAGIMLVFYALEKRKCIAKYILLAIAFVLVFYSSLVRFDSLATTAIALSSIGIILVFKFFKEKDFKHIVEYVLVFAIVFSAPLAAYVYNSHFYNSGDMKYYTEYNSLRSELWDLGFPDYDDNKELYKSMGISKSDLEYYKTWNTDTEVFTLENMQKLVEAKESKVSDSRTLVQAVKDSLKAVYANEFFYLYFAICFLTIMINRKRIPLVLVQFFMLFLSQFYLTYIGRTGLARVDFCVFVGVIISQFYYLDLNAEYIKRPKKDHLIKGLAISLALFVLNFPPLPNLHIPSFDTFYLGHQGNIYSNKFVKTTRNFFNDLGSNKDKLYVTAIDATTYSTGTSMPFFYVCEENCNDNVYCIGGWNRVLPPSEQKIERYNIKNVYRDSINNDSVCFVLGDSVEKIEDYINRNYDKKAKFYEIKNIDGQCIYTLRNHDVVLDKKSIKSVDDTIKTKLKTKKTKYSILVSGYAVKSGADSLDQYGYVTFTDKKTGESKTFDLTFARNGKKKDVMNGKYSAFKTYVSKSKLKKLNPDMKSFEVDNYEIKVVVNIDGQFYHIK